MEWTAARIRQLREVGLSLSQDGFAALAAEQTATQVIPASRDRGHCLAPTLDGLRGAVLGWPLAVRMDMSANSAEGTAETTASAVGTIMAATVQVHRLYQLATQNGRQTIDTDGWPPVRAGLLQ
ncbi:MAG: hypothetical protein ACRDTD_00575 [Pseudonocardiaceae bacterium]